MSETLFENVKDAIAERRRRGDGWRVEPRGDGFVVRPSTPEDVQRDMDRQVQITFDTTADLTISEWDDEDFRNIGRFVAELAAESRARGG